jgi:hypothetical protein
MHSKRAMIEKVQSIVRSRRVEPWYQPIVELLVKRRSREVAGHCLLLYEEGRLIDLLWESEPIEEILQSAAG